MAKLLHMTQSQYQRREKGEIKISDEEWEKIAKALGTTVEEIKEDDRSLGIIHNENSTFHDNAGNYNHYYNIPNSIIDNLQDYINLLKKEIEELKKEVQKLKSK